MEIVMLRVSFFSCFKEEGSTWTWRNWILLPLVRTVDEDLPVEWHWPLSLLSVVIL